MLYVLTEEILSQLSPALVDTVVDALIPDALTAPVVEPTVTGGSHASAGGFTLVPGHALRHVGHTAVHCDLPGVHNLVYLVGVHGDDLLVDWEVSRHVNVYREGNYGPPPLCILLVGQSLEQCGNVILQVLTIQGYYLQGVPEKRVIKKTKK